MSCISVTSISESMSTNSALYDSKSKERSKSSSYVIVGRAVVNGRVLLAMPRKALEDDTLVSGKSSF